MKAAVFHEPGKIIVEDIPDPAARVDEIVVQVRAASICGTDLRIAKHGHFKIPPGTRRVLGHEVAGDVVEVGADVKGYAVGDRVTVTPNVGCGLCRWCRQGLNNMCADYEAFGISLDGGFAEYVRVPGFALQRGNVFHVPDGVPYADAALTEPFSCCYRGQQALQVGFEDTVLVIGAGPIGAFHVMLSALAGAKRIIAANAGTERLEIARKLGAHAVVDVTTADLADVVNSETDGRGADVVIAAVSSAAVQSQAVDLLATHGRLNFFAGLGAGGTAEVDTNRVHYKGLVLTGTTGSSNADYAASLALVGDGRVHLGKLVTATFPIEHLDAAVKHAASGSGMKAMVVFGADEKGSQP
jgi:threonine dehydrogenase-like Zn-dependent dehydrogenase